MIYLATLRPTPPYRFDLLLDVLSRFAHPSLDIAQEGAYWRALRVNGGLALVRVVSSGTVAAPALEAHLAAQSGEIDTPALLDSLSQILCIEAARAPFIAFARGDESLWQVVEPLVGLPEWRAASPFEALAQTIIEQQIAWVAAQRAQRWLVEWAGEGLSNQAVNYYVFPTPERLAAATIDDLTPLKITFKRMGLLIDLAQRVAEGDLDLDALQHETPDAAYRHLLSIKGIGHWTAAVTLERAFGHRDWVAYNDVVLQAATNRHFYGGVGRIPPEQVTAAFAPYGEYAGLAAHYTMIRWVLDQYAPRSVYNADK